MPRGPRMPCGVLQGGHDGRGVDDLGELDMQIAKGCIVYLFSVAQPAAGAQPLKRSCRIGYHIGPEIQVPGHAHRGGHTVVACQPDNHQGPDRALPQVGLERRAYERAVDRFAVDGFPGAWNRLALGLDASRPGSKAASRAPRAMVHVHDWRTRLAPVIQQ